MTMKHLRKNRNGSHLYEKIPKHQNNPDNGYSDSDEEEEEEDEVLTPVPIGLMRNRALSPNNHKQRQKPKRLLSSTTISTLCDDTNPYAVPVAVTLRNLFPPLPSQEKIPDDEDESRDWNMRRRRRRRDARAAMREMLLPTRLEILVPSSCLSFLFPPAFNGGGGDPDVLVEEDNVENDNSENDVQECGKGNDIDRDNPQTSDICVEESGEKDSEQVGDYDTKTEKDGSDGIVEKDSEDEEEGEEEEEEEEEVILFSLEHRNNTIHPLWDHVDEHLDDVLCNALPSIVRQRYQQHDLELNQKELQHVTSPQRKLPLKEQDGSTQQPKTSVIPIESKTQHFANMNPGDIWKELYKSMKVRVQVDDNDTKSNPVTLEHDLQTNQHKRYKGTGKTILLAEAPLHPTNLRRLPFNHNNNPDDDNDNRTVIGKSKYATAIPKSLPPNSILIHYSDGLTRVCPGLYHLLLNQGVISEVVDRAKNGRGAGGGDQEDIMNRTRIEDTIEENKRMKRFEDDIFDVLGASEATVIKTASTRVSGPGKEQSKSKGNSVFEDDGLFDLLGGSSSTATGTDTGISHSEVVVQEEHVNDNTKDNSIQEQKQHEAVTAETTPTVIADIYNYEVDNDEENDGDDDDDAQLDNLTSEFEQLRSILDYEERMLKYDQGALRSGADELQNLIQHVQEIERETDEINRETATEVEKCADVEFLLGARQMKLLKDLRDIYPIQNLSVNAYSIRGVLLPYDLHSMTAATSDEMISSALGFLCHVVFMCSKYLSIPLRYRLICNSSRSAVQDDAYGVFPLFKERVIEKEQFDRGVLLLDRNIDLLLKMKEVPLIQDGSPHMLAKLDRLFQSILELDGVKNNRRS